MSDPGKAVFLSYASQDVEAAKRICEALRAAGVEVWFDQSELVGGDAWDGKIRGQISSCALFMPVISANTQARLEGYFRIEWKIAARRTHAMAAAKAFLLPVVIDDTPDAGAHVPDEFRDVQWTRLKGGETPPAFCARVRKLLEGEVEIRGQTPEIRTQNQEPRTQNLKSRPRWLMPVIAGVAVAVLALALTRPWEKPGISAASATPVGAPQTEAQKLITQMWQIYEKNNDASVEDWLLAEELGARAVKLENNNADAWAAYSLVTVTAWLAGVDYTDAHFNEGRSRAERAMSLAPNSLEARFVHANCLRMKPATRVEGEGILRELVREAPTDKRILRTLAGTLRMEGRFDEALAVLDQAIALPGDNVAALMGKSAVFRQAGRYAEQEEMIDQILAVRSSPYAYLWKAHFQISRYGNLDEARALMEKIPAVYLAKDDGAHFASRLWLWRKDYDRSVAALGEISRDFVLNRLAPDRYLGEELRPFLTGQARQLAGKKAAADIDWRFGLQKMEQRLAAEPGQPVWLFWKARLQAHLNDRTEAERTLEAFRQLAVPDPATKFATALVLAPLGRVDEAVDQLVDAVEKADDLGFIARDFWKAMVRYDPSFDALRGDARFDALVARLIQAKAPATSDQRSAPGSQPSASDLKSNPSNLAPSNPVPPDSKSVAVLAFANLSEDKANEYFSDGISEELLNVLAKVPGLKVSARTSAFYFKGKEVPVPEIAKQLGVAYVIEGSVRKQGDKVRIAAKLVKAADGFPVWSDTFTRDLKDIFAVQDEIAGLIAKNLELKIGVSSAASKAAVNPQAFEFYAQARRAWSLRNAAGYTQAEELLTRALALEPDFARAHAALADVWTLRALTNGVTGTFGLRDAPIFSQITSEINKALALDPDSSEAHASMGIVIRMQQWDLAGTERELRRAVELNPNYATAHHWLGNCLFESGWIEESMAERRRATELDPFSPSILRNYARSLLDVGRYAEALPMADRSLALQPRDPAATGTKFEALLKLGRRAEASAVVRELDEADRVELLAAVGEKSGAEAALAEAEGWSRYQLLVALGRTREAVANLRAEDVPAAAVGRWLMDPGLDPFRKDPHFVELLKTLGLTEAHARMQAWRAAHPPAKP